MAWKRSGVRISHGPKSGRAVALATGYGFSAFGGTALWRWRIRTGPKIMEKYDFKTIEKKWQAIWEKTRAHKAKDTPGRSKFYCLDFFPYPSGEGLHVGHWRGYVLSDIIARYQKLHGKNILHPMGYDAFGLPAENAAIKENSHPKIFTEKAIKRFQKQLREIGAMYDWNREINSSDPSYYKWTQWIFLKLYHAGLAYRKKAPVNWCPGCQTVLANEQVVAGVCERCGSKVTKKELTQWFFKITDYAEKLLGGLDKLDWPERTKTLQSHWIGKSEGAIIKFKMNALPEAGQNTKFKIDVFTTRPDTLYGATFMVLAPEHPIVQQITTQENIDSVQNYIEKTRLESELFRENPKREKTGVFTGAYAINPVNGAKIPIWIADYVLLYYGSGACMCVPAHDVRDFEFAKKFKLPIIQVISADGKKNKNVLPYVESGINLNSGPYNGLESLVVKKKITEDLKKKELADFAVNFRLRDWLISRQRYWGAPIPIVYCEFCGEVPVPEKDLPILLPDDIEFRPRGDSPLKQSKKFVETSCPNCSGKARRETDTMDTFVDSSWYFLRFADPQNNQEFASQKALNNWMPVDLYVGGIEHATMHLLYARFVSLALHKLGFLKFNESGEPFQKLFNIGLIYLHGAKMSKSKGNVVNPDDLVEKYGSDALRGYEMFVGPALQDSEWQVSGIVGIYRFLEKLWKFVSSIKSDSRTSIKNQALIHQTTKKITIDIENFHLNTAIATLMSTLNSLDTEISQDDFSKLLIIVSPIFPHIAEEIWQKMGHKNSIFNETWPKFDSAHLGNEKIKIAVQVNGKLRDLIVVGDDSSKEKIINQAKTAKVKLNIGDSQISKTIYIPGKIINFVIK